MSPALAEVPRLQARNSAAFWTAVGLSRGDRVIRRPGFLAVTGNERTGLRILIQELHLDAQEIAEITDLTREAQGQVNVEDPFSRTDLRHLPLRSWQMPLMLRTPGATDTPKTDIHHVRDEPGLRAAERTVIAGFEMARFEPYRPGEFFPRPLLDQPGVDFYLALDEGTPVGACVTVVAGDVGSHYWVATPPAYRSRGVGRAVMLGSLAPMADLPVTLTASRLGRPLYESLGFTTAAPSTWWASLTPPQPR